MDVRLLSTDADREAAVPIMQQLWSDADAEEILEWTGEDDYRLFGRFDDGELVGVAGVLVRDVLHHARHAWLYDLVVAESRRGEGHGSALVSFVESWADEHDCEHVALASPLEKTDVHRYYEDRGYERWGYVIEKSL
ncbi:GNAT family N-acetyltransferase [Natrarchaeobius oligotrophus]|uniref:GNAT family N-acetyltransferase n=1 Tax=Natrarchaeobius chitinivorans TaxID=1679083 RepID=A0A3N6NS86_NATCH|nr:GNAT family N-acetyltransferase [Natrarchaeobius chitinivorans]RQH03053.1 GNAT family N-acetyltransferase [Natrarchaeobius chitinivorans]